MNNCFLDEVNKTVNDIKKVMTDDSLCFALLTDTKLSDTGDDTRENIKAVDKEIGFDFIVHLGNVTNGNNPEKITRYLLELEMEKYKHSIIKKKLFVTPGIMDGWRDERFPGQLITTIMTDEVWCDETEFINLYDNVCRESGKPYYYVDFPEQMTRLVFLYPYYTQMDKHVGTFQKTTVIDVEQAAWLKAHALNAPKGYTALIFTSAIPKSRFETGNDQPLYHGASMESILMILQQAKKSGVNIAGVIGGGYGYDAEISVGDINHAVIASQAPYIVNSAKCEGVRFLENRDLDTLNQDCWDAVVLSPKTNEMHIFRFGAGEDRKLNF